MTKKKRLIYLSGFSLIAILFFIVSYLVNLDFFRKLDYDTMVWFQSIFTRVIDVPFSIISVIGSTEITLVILFSVFIFLLLRKKRLFSGLMIFFLIFVIEIFGKLFIIHPMPPKIFHRYVFDFRMPISFFVNTEYSFPSGHTSRISYLVVIFLFLIFYFAKNKKLKLVTTGVSFLILIMVFVSRIYLGEHWLSDVLGGFLLGSGLGLLSIVLW